MIVGEKLLQMIQSVSKEANPHEEKAIKTYATVISTKPISIKIDGMNDTIPSQFIQIGALCRRYVIPQTHIHFDPHNGQTSVETDEIELWRGLRAGDKVIVSRMNSGQLYFIDQRVEMEGFRD